MMKLLRSAIMSQKNLLSVDNCVTNTKLIRAMNHYYAEVPAGDWVYVFSKLVKTFTFPRALIYCDTESIGAYFAEMQSMGIAVSANLPGASSDARQAALSDFTSNKT